MAKCQNIIFCESEKRKLALYICDVMVGKMSCNGTCIQHINTCIHNRLKSIHEKLFCVYHSVCVVSFSYMYYALIIRTVQPFRVHIHCPDSAQR